MSETCPHCGSSYTRSCLLVKYVLGVECLDCKKIFPMTVLRLKDLTGDIEPEETK